MLKIIFTALISFFIFFNNLQLNAQIKFSFNEKSLFELQAKTMAPVYDFGVLITSPANALPTPGSKGLFIAFSKSTIYFNRAANGIFKLLKGDILNKWAALNYDNGKLGMVTKSEEATKDKKGSFADFELGSIYWKSEFGAIAVMDVFRDYKKDNEKGYTDSEDLGFPKKDEIKINNGDYTRYQPFENGTLFYNSRTGRVLEMTDPNATIPVEMPEYIKPKGPPPPAPVAFNGGTFIILNSNSQLAVAVSGNSKLNGGNVLQWENKGQPDIYWNFVKQAAGDYIITNLNSGRVLAIDGQRNNNGDNIVIWSNNKQKGIYWKVENKGMDKFAIINSANGKCLDVSDFSKNNGARIHQWDYNKTENQHWQFRVDGKEETEIYNVNAYDLFTELNNRNYCTIKRHGAGTQNPLMIYNEKESDNKSWKLYANPVAGAAYYTMAIMEGLNLRNGFTFEKLNSGARTCNTCKYEITLSPTIGDNNLYFRIRLEAKAKPLSTLKDDASNFFSAIADFITDTKTEKINTDYRAIFYIHSFTIRGPKGKNWKDALPPTK